MSIPGACPACGGLYVGRLSWFVVMTNARAEEAVNDRLKDLGYLTLFLHYRVPVRRANRLSRRQRAAVATEKAPELVTRPYLSRYIFVGVVPGQGFYDINNAPGVSTVLSNEAGPRTLEPSEIDRLRAGAGKDGLIQLEGPAEMGRTRLTVGDVVRIKVGPFAGFDGTVCRDDGKMVTIWVSIFGRQTEVTLLPKAVEAI
ncbi:transcription termination/antitermination protein NusG [Pelagibius sp.]|uniref:transcription termination/antitermination protein NusG n=1 Tax=Pelagibius sp. TaxID=1931238 RepID=UPI003C79D57C